MLSAEVKGAYFWHRLYVFCHSVYLQLASCLIYAWSLLEYVIFILWVRSVSKMLPSVKFAEDKVLTLILCEKC